MMTDPAVPERPGRRASDKTPSKLAALTSSSESSGWRGPPLVDGGELARELESPTAAARSVPLLWALTCARLAHLGGGSHSRMLHVALAALGLHAADREPAWMARLGGRAMRLTPGWLRTAVFLNVAVATSVVLAHLLRLVRPMFGQQPGVCEKVEGALGEVLAGEVAEVERLRGAMGWPARWMAWGLRRFVLAGFLDAVPEVEPLIGRERLAYACRAIDTAALALAASRARGAVSSRPRPGRN